jgi:hypothetical protein
VTGVLRDVLTSPAAWIVGAAGFLARGGALILALPILSLPTPVGVTLLVPPLSVTTSGVSSVLAPQLIAAGALVAVLVILALFLGALTDLAAYGRIAVRGAPDLADVRWPRSPAVLVVQLMSVEILALLPAAAAGLAVAARLVTVGEQEYLLPSSLAVPYVVRLLRGASAEVAALAVCLLLADVVNALLSRRILRAAFTVAAPGATSAGPAVVQAGRGRSALLGVRSLLACGSRIVATWLAAWSITLASLAPGLFVIGMVWPLVRDAYAATSSPAPPAPLVLLGVTLLLVAVWLAAVLLAGLGSALRAGLWSSLMFPAAARP